MATVVVGPLTDVGAFTELTDTPNTLEGSEGKFVRIRSDGLGLEFSDSTGSLEFQNRTEIELQFKIASSTQYKELTYSSGDIVNIGIFTSNAKTTKLFNRDLTYSLGGLLETVTTTDVVTGNSLVKTLSYSGEILSSVTSVYTTV